MLTRDTLEQYFRNFPNDPKYVKVAVRQCHHAQMHKLI